jgi:hypothetical protein
MHSLLVLLVTLMTAEVVQAHLSNYGPFAPKNGPKLFSVRKVVERYAPGNIYLAEADRTRESSNPIIRFSPNKKQDGQDLTVLTFDNKRIVGPLHVSRSPVGPSGYSADLNGDGATDFILIISQGANGSIGGGLADVVFVLSAGKTYSVSMVSDLYPGPDDFLDIDGRFFFLNTKIFGVFENARGKDGRIHNYWIYNLIGVDGSKLRVENSALPEFPKWIMFTFAANHSETDQFTAEQKLRFFNPDTVCIVSTPDRPCPRFFQ